MNLDYRLPLESYTGPSSRDMRQQEVTIASMRQKDAMAKREEQRKNVVVAKDEQRKLALRELYKKHADPVTGALDQQGFQADAYQAGFPEAAQAEQARAGTQETQAIENINKETQTQDFDNKIRSTYMDLQNKKIDLGVSATDKWATLFRGREETPEAEKAYQEWLRPHMSEAGLPESMYPEKYDPITTPALIYHVQPMAKEWKDRNKIQQDESTLSGNMPSGVPTEEKRHNLASENAARITANKPSAGSTPMVGTVAELSPQQQEFVKNIADNVVKGNIDPSLNDLPQRGGQAGMKVYIMQDIANRYPDFNPVLANGSLKYWNDKMTKRQLQVMDVVDEQLPVLQKAITLMKQNGIQKMNDAVVGMLAQSGNVNASNYIAASTVSVEDIAKAIAGGGSITDDQLTMANRLIPRGATVGQMEAILKQIKSGVTSRKTSVYKQGGIYGKIAAQNDKDPEFRSKYFGAENAGIAPEHPQDNEAVTWAKSHSNDPRAKKILQLNGK
jgi:hypothetical protein